MRRTAVRGSIAAASIALALSLASCSSPTGAGNASGEAIELPERWDGDPVTLRLWHDNAAMKVAVDLFNDANAEDGIEIEFQENTDLAKNIRNAHAAGNGPDLFVTQTADLAGYISEGIAADLTPYYSGIENDYLPVVNDAVSLGDFYYAIPAADIPTFMLYNEQVFVDRGLALPTTYEEFLETAKEIRADGTYAFNVAGEDPSTFLNMSWEAGASWWTLEGDAWRIDIDSEATQRVAEYFDEAFENDLFSKISYAEYAAMMQSYDADQIAARQLSTWQTKGMQANLADGLGDWLPAPNLQFEGAGPANAAFTRVYAVNSDSENIDAAAFAAHWLSTEPESVEALADPDSGLAWFPAVADPAPYIEISTPTALIGDHADQWQPVVEEAVATQSGDWTYGPNYAGAFSRLVDLWGQAVAGDIATVDIAPQLQKWVVDDMKSQGYTVTE